MPKKSDSLNNELYNILSSQGYDPVSYDSDGTQLPVPDEADVFQIHFRHDGTDYGAVTITIDGLKKMKIYYNDSIFGDMKNNDAGDVWLNFVKQLKRFAQRRQLGFSLKNMDRLGNDMKRRSHEKKINEGYYGNKNTSYSDNTPKTVRMIIKHSKPLEEGEQRFRHIEKIFIENSVGERLLVPSTKPSMGRVFARHLAEGGQHLDERWNHIAEIAEDINHLGGFVRATRTKQFNESVQRMVSEALTHYTGLRETVKRLQTSRGYNKYFESWSPAVLSEQDSSDLAGVFTNNTLDPRIERALPVLSKLKISVTEMSEASQFESWANDILEETLNPSNDQQVDELVDLIGPDSEPLPIGPDAVNAIGELRGVLENDSLNLELRQAASGDPDFDAKPVIVAWLQKHSDEDKSYSDVLAKITSEEEPNPPKPPEPAEPAAPEEPEPETPEAPEPEASAAPEEPEPLAETDQILSRLRRLSGLK